MDEGITEEQKNRILHKEIDLVEDAISRMAKNAFLIKGWCLSVLAFVFALAGKFSVGKLSFLLLVPVISFWWLDSYYLRLERLFRKRYEDVIRKRTLEQVWTDLYSMNLKPYLQNVQGEIRIMFSSSEFPFYGVISAVLFIIGVLGCGLCEGLINRIAASQQESLQVELHFKNDMSIKSVK